MFYFLKALLLLIAIGLVAVRVTLEYRAHTTLPSAIMSALQLYLMTCYSPYITLLTVRYLPYVIPLMSHFHHFSPPRDLLRPEAARALSKQSMNFLFLGNPGTGKTTVARLYAEILSELKIREDKFVEASGQKLLSEGAAKFPATLQSVTPGVLFIDEVYQLNPKGQGEGQAITNLLMDEIGRAHV